MQQLQELFLNFWYWWYVEQLLTVVDAARLQLANLAGRSGLMRQLQSFARPLYPDSSAVGRIASIAIRSLWILFAGVLQLAGLAIAGSLFLVYLAFPLIPLLKLWSTLI